LNAPILKAARWELTGVVAMGALIWLFDDRHHDRLARLGSRWKSLSRRTPAAIADQQRRLDRHLGPGRVFIPFAEPSVQYLGSRTTNCPEQHNLSRGQTHHADA